MMKLRATRRVTQSATSKEPRRKARDGFRFKLHTDNVFSLNCGRNSLVCDFGFGEINARRTCANPLRESLDLGFRFKVLTHRLLGFDCVCNSLLRASKLMRLTLSNTIAN